MEQPVPVPAGGGRPPRSEGIGEAPTTTASTSDSTSSSGNNGSTTGGSSSTMTADEQQQQQQQQQQRRVSTSSPQPTTASAAESDLYSSWLGDSASSMVGAGPGLALGVAVGVGSNASLSALELSGPAHRRTGSSGGGGGGGGPPPTHRRSGSSGAGTSGGGGGWGSGGVGSSSAAAWAGHAALGSLGVGPGPFGAAASRNNSIGNGSEGGNGNGSGSRNGGHRRSSSDVPDAAAASAASEYMMYGSARPGSMTSGNRAVSVPVAVAAGASRPPPSASSSSLPSSSSSSDPNAVTSLIHEAARITNWDRVHSLSLSHPASARYVGPDRWTALHHACSRRCPHPYVVEALFRAHPAALLCLDEKQWTPLTHAARFKAPRDVVRLLLHDHPDMGRVAASKRCSRGRSPLFYAIRYDAPEGVVEMLLEANPEAVLEPDRDGVTPLGLVWDRYVTSFEGRRAVQPYVGMLHAALGDHDKHHGHLHGSDGDVKSGEGRKELEGGVTITNKKLKAKWERANMLLRASFRFPLTEDTDGQDGGDAKVKLLGKEGASSEDDEEVDDWEKIDAPQDEPEPVMTMNKKKKRKWRILHAASAVRCHPTLFQLACVMHPEQATELDDNDLYYDGGGSDSAAAASPEWTRTALHLAAASPAHGKDGRTILTSLIALNPEAPSIADGITGSLPFHIAVENERKVHWIHDGIAALYEANPDAVKAQDSRGRTPLHRACTVIGHRPAIGVTVATVPGPAPTPTPGDTDNEETAAAPAGDAASANTDEALTSASAATSSSTVGGIGSIVRNLVTLYPEAASVADDDGRLPLHVIAKCGEGWSDDAESVLAAHPAAAQIRAGRSAPCHARLPIHMAAAGPDAGPELISRLVAAHPRSASMPDGLGKLPLHLACESGKAWEDGVRILYEAYPSAVAEKEDNGRGWTALHMAASCPHCGPGLIDSLIEIHPDATFEADMRGQLPLHLCCASGKSWDADVRTIFDANPDAAIAPNSLGLLPFHCAAMSYSVLSSGGPMASSEVAPMRSRSSVSSSSGDSIVTTHTEHDASSGQNEAQPDEPLVDGESEDILAKIDLMYCLLKQAPDVLYSQRKE